MSRHELLPLNPHALPSDRVLEFLKAGSGGLTSAEARKRIEAFGPNRIPESARPRLGRIFLRQFFNPLIAILLVVAVLSVVIGHFTDAIFIGVVLVFNAIIGTAQEYGAEKSAEALREMARGKAHVVRDGVPNDIDADQLVPGDVVRLESGDKVPADLRLLQAQDLALDESLLTGESVPLEKHAESISPENSPIGDRLGMAFAGTLVTRGRAIGAVVGTALNSELGRIAESVQGRGITQTPLLVRMERFTRNLAVLFIIAMVVISAVLLARGEPVEDVFFVAVALGVAAIPEGLPVALTIALAIASRRMARRNVIVRKLSAVEALGSCTAIGTDKTGTLTINQLTAKRLLIPGFGVFSVDDRKSWPPEISESAKRIATAIRLSTETGSDAMDRALLAMVSQLGLSPEEIASSHREIGLIPYESKNGFSAALHESGGFQIVSAKGAPERILAMCRDGTVSREQMIRDAERLATEGYRVLAIAARSLAPGTLDRLEASRIEELECLALVGLIDPLRPDAVQAIADARRAGIEVAMITGDHPATAQAIARELGIDRVHARVAPEAKLEIVESMIREGHFVAVTGDGANDAPALKAAHVGVAMGRSGTDVAKETADLILADDRFSSIVAAIEEGRVAYSNVRKVIYLLVSTGFSEIVLILLSTIAGLPVPLSAVQLLWLNLVTEGIQGVGLAFEGPEGDELSRRPRDPKEPIFDRLMRERVLLTALVIGILGFLTARHFHLQGLPAAQVQNHVLLLMVLFENMMVFIARSETRPSWQLPFLTNPLLLVGTVTAQLVHIAAMHIPVTQKFLSLSPMSWGDWLKHLAIASSVFLLMEAHKAFHRGRSSFRERPRSGTKGPGSIRQE